MPVSMVCSLTVSVTSLNCDITEYRVWEEMLSSTPYYFHHIDTINVNSLKGIDNSKTWQ